MFLLIGSPSPYWPTMAMVNCTLSGVTRAGNKFLAAARERALLSVESQFVMLQ